MATRCAFRSDHYRCTGERYHSTTHADPKTTRLRRDARLLFFGTSLMGQIVDEILCSANVTRGVDHRWVKHMDNRYTMKRLPRPCTPVCATHEFATYTSATGATLTTLINWAPMQRFSRAQHFQAFLRRSNFTHIYFMMPHDECFFDWTRDKTKPFCINTLAPYRPKEAYVRVYSSILERSGTAWHTVLPWTQHARHGEARAIATRPPLLARGLCATPRCSNKGEYHQCQPGPIAAIADHLQTYLPMTT